MSEPTFEEIADGMALWQEAKPQTKEDWIEIARRFSEAESALRTRLDAAEKKAADWEASFDKTADRLDAAEADRDRAVEALRLLVDVVEDGEGLAVVSALEHARAVLAEQEKEQG